MAPNKGKGKGKGKGKKHNVDRLSNLPEPILSHILSFLPTETAVACSILSQKWKFLWTSLPNLDLDCTQQNKKYEFCEPDDDFVPEASFVHFVYRVLLLRTEWRIRKFRLKFESDRTGDDRHAGTWVSAAVARGVEELDVSFSEFTFPRSLLSSCNNLVVLKLSDCQMCTVESCHFPSLKVLHLSRVYFDSDESDSFQNFLSGCPVLEELVLKISCGDDLSDELRICVATLIRLMVEFEIDTGSRWYPTDGQKLVLETPALEYLSLKHPVSEDSSLEANLPNLAEADIDSCLAKHEIAAKSYGSGEMKLLTALSSVRSLKLSWGTMRVLGCSSLNELGVFHNLVRLELNIRSSDCVLIPLLLKKFPSLKSIVIDKEKLDREVGDKTCWKEPLQVPMCLSSHLVTLCFRGFGGMGTEMEFITYILKNSMVLKHVTISSPSCIKVSSDVRKKLSMVRKGSKACQLQFK